jgi:hypothetical protein
VCINQELFHGHLQEHRDAANEEVANEKDPDLRIIEAKLTALIANTLSKHAEYAEVSVEARASCRHCMNHFELFEGYDVEAANKIRLRDAILVRYGTDIFTDAMRTRYESEAAVETAAAHEFKQRQKTLGDVNREWKKVYGKKERAQEQKDVAPDYAKNIAFLHRL